MESYRNRFLPKGCFVDRMEYRLRKIVNDGKERATIFLQVQLTREEVAAVKRLATSAKQWRRWLRDFAQEAVETKIRLN